MSLDSIEHVVVLMLENRSFDSLLGWLYETDQPELFIPPTPGAPYRGLQTIDPAAFVNTALKGTLTAGPTRGAAGFTVPDVDPGEEFEHVTRQFFGCETPDPTDKITMRGLLEDFVDILEARKLGEADIRRVAGRILEGYTPGQLPVLNQLARHYAVSDGWYASVPSQTNPNRAFLMCGTSNGMVNNGDLETDKRALELRRLLGVSIGDDRVDAPTIFNALEDAGADWTVFWQTSYLPRKISTVLDGLPDLIPLLTPWPALRDAATAILDLLKPYTEYLTDLSSGELASSYTWRLFPQIRDRIPNAADHFQRLDDFHRRARAGELPKFSYIEPFWTISPTSTDNPLLTNLASALGNDYHPPSNLLVGEEFLKEVYASLIANEAAWQKTLLLITFDEFVGVFDHEIEGLAPGVVQTPWAPDDPPKFKSPTGFQFDRLGARVPTILVSPFVQKGAVFRSETNTPYDHTSVIATTLKWLGQPMPPTGFGARTAAAPTFENVLTLTTPRTDAAALPFLDAPRAVGDTVRWGESLVLKNQHGQYLSAFKADLKAVGGAGIIPAGAMGICVDLEIAAFFPTLADEGADVSPARLTFLTPVADPPAGIADGSAVMLVSREPDLWARNALGAWKDSHDCYYDVPYLDGADRAKQTWTLQQVSRPGEPLRYGDRVYLVNGFFAGERLTRDARPVVGAGWITTADDGDWWTVEAG